MAAVLGCALRDEVRLPYRRKAVLEVERGQTAVFGVDEDHPALGIDAEFVDVDVAGGLGIPRHEHRIEHLVADLAGRNMFSSRQSWNSDPRYSRPSCQRTPTARWKLCWLNETVPFGCASTRKICPVW
jgi:hypothetical protein